MKKNEPTIILNQTSDAIPEIERSQVCQGKVIYGNHEHQNAVLVLCGIIFCAASRRGRERPQR